MLGWPPGDAAAEECLEGRHLARGCPSHALRHPPHHRQRLIV